MRYLCIDIGSTYTKAALVETEPAALCALSRAPTTIATDVNEGIEAATRALHVELTGKERLLVCSSAAGGLAIAAIGLTPELTMEAARLAALGAGGKVVGSFSFMVTESDIRAIQSLRPDIILLSGGIDGGNINYIVHNGTMCARHFPETPVIVAGNRAAEDDLRRIFNHRTDVLFTENVMPVFGRINSEPAQEQIRRCFLERIIYAKGLENVFRQAHLLLPTPQAVCNGAALAAQGPDKNRPGIGDCIVIDIGGATTDVISVCDGKPETPATILKGLPQPFIKRTVEADIGIRRSLSSLVEQIRQSPLDADLLEREETMRWITRLTSDYFTLPQNAEEYEIDYTLAGCACRIALERHCGTVETVYTAAGPVAVQQGKDCRRVTSLIGTGGIMHSSEAAAKILRHSLAVRNPSVLKPAAPDVMVDTKYVLWMIGLLSAENPDAAFSLAHDCLTLCHLQNQGSNR